MQPFKIISFYCDRQNDSYYTDSYIKFVNKLNELNIKNYDIEHVEYPGSYSRAVLMKPNFILKKLNQHKMPVLWLDIDTYINKMPLHFDNIKEDMCFVGLRDKLYDVYASPQYYSYTSNSIYFLEKISYMCFNTKNNFDHEILVWALHNKFFKEGTSIKQIDTKENILGKGKNFYFHIGARNDPEKQLETINVNRNNIHLKGPDFVI